MIQTRSYGAGARGSAAKSEVIISDQKSGFPTVRKSDIMVVMSQTALDKHLKDLKENGVLIMDRDTIKEAPSAQAQVFKVQATQTAETELKSKMFANMVMLGAITKITKIVTQDAVEKAIKDTFSAEAADKNIKAFRTGLSLIDR